MPHPLLNFLILYHQIHHRGQANYCSESDTTFTVKFFIILDIFKNSKTFLRKILLYHTTKNGDAR